MLNIAVAPLCYFQQGPQRKEESMVSLDITSSNFLSLL